jgi:dipeptidyl aminopeptidase/acylaminoacyl peptidase
MSQQGPLGSGGEADEVFAMLRQLDTQIQQLRVAEEQRPAQPRPREAAWQPTALAAPAGAAAAEGSLSPSLAAEILARLDRLDTQLVHVHTMVQLEQLEAQLQQLRQLAQAKLTDSKPGAANGDATAPAVEAPPRRDARLVRLPSAVLPEAEREPTPGTPLEPAPLRPTTASVETEPAAESATASVLRMLNAPASPEREPTPARAAAPVEPRPTAPPRYADDEEDWDDDDAGGGLRRWLLIGAAVLVVMVLLALAAFFVPRMLPPTARDAAPTKPAATAEATGRIVFQSDRDTPGQPQLYSIRPGESTPTRLPISIPYAWNPRLSPDGQRIAFIGRVGGVDDIYVVGFDGTKLQRVTNNNRNNRHPSWSPDGLLLAYGSDRAGNWDIFVSKLDGAEARNLTNSPSDDNLPAWSPDGKKIAFQSDRSGKMQIFVMDAAGGSPTNISNSPGPDQYPQWSPNGDVIAFYSGRTGNNEIFLMNADGGDPQNLTNHPATDELAVWSPDANFLIFASDRDGKMGLYTLRMETGAVTRLAESTSRDSEPTWGR